jgi:hypothetical protein
MKIRMSRLQSIVREAVLEARKAQTLVDFDPEEHVEEKDRPDGYRDVPAFDFSKPLGDRNRLKAQGQLPVARVTTVEDRVRALVRPIVREALRKKNR